MCVSNFRRDKAAVCDSILQQKSELRDPLIFEWCSNLDFLIKESISLLLEDWEVPVLSREIEGSLIFSTRSRRPFYSIETDAVFDFTPYQFSVSFMLLAECSETSGNGTPEGYLTTRKCAFDVSGVGAIFKSGDFVAFVCPKHLSIYDLID